MSKGIVRITYEYPVHCDITDAVLYWKKEQEVTGEEDLEMTIDGLKAGHAKIVSVEHF